MPDQGTDSGGYVVVGGSARFYPLRAGTDTTVRFLSSTTGHTWTQYNTPRTTVTTGTVQANIEWPTYTYYDAAPRHRMAESAEHARVREEQRQSYLEQQRELRQKRDAAEAVAKATLLEFLDTYQLHTYEASGYFDVQGSSGTRWRIACREGISGNVYRLNEKSGVTAQLCAHPPGLPNSDVFLQQKLALETDDIGFERVANIHSGLRRPEAYPERRAIEVDGATYAHGGYVPQQAIMDRDRLRQLTERARQLNQPIVAATQQFLSATQEAARFSGNLHEMLRRDPPNFSADQALEHRRRLASHHEQMSDRLRPERQHRRRRVA